jgi:hypothetical protein
MTFLTVGQIACVMTITAMIDRIQIVRSKAMRSQKRSLARRESVKLLLHLRESFLITEKHFTALAYAKTGNLPLDCFVVGNTGINLLLSCFQEMAVLKLSILITANDGIVLCVCN